VFFSLGWGPLGLRTPRAGLQQLGQRNPKAPELTEVQGFTTSLSRNKEDKRKNR